MLFLFYLDFGTTSLLWVPGPLGGSPTCRHRQGLRATVKKAVLWDVVHPSSVYQSMGSFGYLSGRLILWGCTPLVQGFTLNMHESYLQKLLVKAGQLDLCLDWSGASSSLLF